MAGWRPMENPKEQPNHGCDVCGSKTGRSIDTKNRVFCPAHRGHHDS